MSASGPKKIMVTGALGQIGTELVEELRKIHGNDNILATDVRKLNDNPGVQNGPFEILSVVDSDLMDNLVKEYDIQEIFHLAAILSATGEKKPELCKKINIGGTISVLETALNNNLKIFAPSSIAVFGPDAPKNAPQITSLNPTTVYGQTKVIGENLANEYWEKNGVDTRGLRYPGLISWKSPAGGGTTDYAVEIFHAALEKGHYDCFVSPETRLPMMYIDDAIRATLELMNTPVDNIGESRAGYNISGLSFTAQQLADTISEKIDGFTCTFTPDNRQVYADSWPNSIDDSQAKDDWGWEAQYNLENIVDSMIEGLSK
ncbi:MAG: NAD-dependent epimerase/dehydratase family protein [Candidatus Thalassarchaeaceae archaeon]